MKITFLFPAAAMTGGCRVIAIYAQKLVRRGHEVTIISVPPKVPSIKQCMKSFLRGRGWPPRKHREPSHFDNIDIAHKVIESRRPFTDADVPDADVVIATWWETAEWMSALSRQKGVKVHFVQGHEVFSNQPIERVKATYCKPYPKITISHWLVDTMKEEYHAAEVFHVPNSVDTELFYAPERKKQASPIIGLLYAWSTVKGVDVSLKAIDLVRQRFPDVRLMVFGSQPLKDELPLPENSEFLFSPPQEKIRELYAKCDVWLCGSRSEGFHLAPLEAMACRCPVVSTRVGGPLDIIEQGVNGYLVDIEDVRALADALINVIHLPDDKWLEMSDAAYTTATKYSWEEAADLFEAVLKKIVKN